MQNSCSVGEEEISTVPQPYASYDIPDPVIDQPINRSPGDNANIKPLKEEIMVSFLDEVNKKIVSDGIKQRKRDEKLAKVESISSEKGKQVSVNKKALRKKEQREKFIWEASKDSSTKCSNTMALIQRRSKITSEKQVDPESNAVSRILNMEVKAQLPADTSDALLWKRIKQAKKL
ncbi:unnamed protein product [Rhizophagus irregularis]|nr:unnamed protein product [Rhizophagus irregularis]